MNKTLIIIGLAFAMTSVANANEPYQFMSYETEQQRIVEANGECELHGQVGANKQACVSAYYCSNWNECDGENTKRPIESTPWGVYRDTQ